MAEPPTTLRPSGRRGPTRPDGCTDVAFVAITAGVDGAKAKCNFEAAIPHETRGGCMSEPRVGSCLKRFFLYVLGNLYLTVESQIKRHLEYLSHLEHSVHPSHQIERIDGSIDVAAVFSWSWVSGLIVMSWDILLR